MKKSKYVSGVLSPKVRHQSLWMVR